MCSRIKQNGQIYRVGSSLSFTPDGSGKAQIARWGSSRGIGFLPPFARSETLKQKWLLCGWREGRLTTEGIAERAHTGELRWSARPVTIKVVYAEVSPGVLQLAVVTKQATPREHRFFGHPRTPVAVRAIRSVTA